VCDPTPPEPIPGTDLLFSLDRAVTYLNHGAVGAVPVSVQRAQQRLRDETEANPLRFYAHGLVGRVSDARREAAAFLGADPDGCAFVGNVTTAVSLVLNSLDLHSGDEIVTTDHGYGAVRFAVDHACARAGAVHTVVELSLCPTDDEVVDAVRAAAGDRTRLVIVDHVTSPTARLFPVARVVSALRGTGVPVLVDAAHVPGQLPVRVDAIGADFWVGNLHKWAFAPPGTALLAVAPAWREKVRPLVVSWEHAAGYPHSVEHQGTLDYTPWLASTAGLRTLRSLGLSAVHAHNTALVAYGQHAVGRAVGLDPDTLPSRPAGLSMALVPLPAGLVGDQSAASALCERIADRLGAEVSVNAWGGRGLLRLSAQVYNRAGEYDRFAGRLAALLADG